MENKQTYDLVDFMKFIFSILIIAIHTNAMGFNILGRLGVPFFFIISSYFFFKKYLTKNSKEQYQQLKLYLKRLFLLFLSWQIIYLPNSINLLIHNYKILNGDNHPIITTIYMSIRFILFGNNDGWGQSWYLFATFYGTILICLLRKWITDWMILNCGLLIQIILMIKFNFLKLLPEWYDFTFLRSIFYIMIGLYLAKYPNIIFKIKDKIPSKKMISISGIIILLFFLEHILLFILFGISGVKEIGFLTDITAIIIAVIVLSYNNIKIPHAKIYRELSTFIFCIHILFIRILYPLLHIKFPSIGLNYPEFIITTLLSILCFFIYKYLTKKFQNQKWLNYFI